MCSVFHRYLTHVHRKRDLHWVAKKSHKERFTLSDCHRKACSDVPTKRIRKDKVHRSRGEFILKLNFFKFNHKIIHSSIFGNFLFLFNEHTIQFLKVCDMTLNSPISVYSYFCCLILCYIVYQLSCYNTVLGWYICILYVRSYIRWIYISCINEKEKY